jgi:hypothetical protein
MSSFEVKKMLAETGDVVQLALHSPGVVRGKHRGSAKNSSLGTIGDPRMLGKPPGRGESVTM